ncbi:hypothetical protein PAPYR_6233 [Paratrimastix pyriformis]|uniref:CBM20 domain-containing protein n=1 Tax=Paratrimastix pyriformis TaxID=342808 RepID=A0ABQ8UMY8_9EUKA|nr:hypothetical protein PAPYR_6233 [Paratrimastix pyriformis]
MQVSFELRCEKTQWGQSVWLFSSATQWRVGWKLEAGKDYPVWKGCFRVPSGFFEYKYVISESGDPSGLSWENISRNRTLTIPDSHAPSSSPIHIDDGTYGCLPLRMLLKTLPPTPVRFAICVLGKRLQDGGVPLPMLVERCRFAAELYRTLSASDQAGIVILSGARVNPNSPITEAECMEGLMTREGVPSGVIIREECARNTIENILYCRALLLGVSAHPECLTSLVMITSGFHLPRTRIISHRFLEPPFGQALRYEAPPDLDISEAEMRHELEVEADATRRMPRGLENYGRSWPLP